MTHPVTYYSHTADLNHPYPSLSGTHEAEVCIIGGGYAGLSTALGLAERGCTDVVLLEANRVGYGCSGRNGGFAFGGYSLHERALVKKLGREKARRLYRYTTDGIELIRHRIKHYEIDCDVYWDGVLLCNWFKDPQILRDQQQFMADEMGVELDYIAPDALRESVKSERYHGGLIEKNAFHFHPLKYALGIAQAASQLRVRIYENTRVTRINADEPVKVVETAVGQIKAKQLVVCGGGYMEGLYKPLAQSILPIATFVMATEPLGTRRDEAFTCNYAIYDTRFAFDYYRPLPDSRILWGGRITANAKIPANLGTELCQDLLKVYPQLHGVKIDFAWHGFMSWAAHKMPQIGQQREGVWYGQAYGGHGVAATNITGDMLAGAIAEGDDRYRDLADHFGLPPAFGLLGKLAAESTYRWYQLKDRLKE